jgi:sugar lactone lactonase YvrE
LGCFSAVISTVIIRSFGSRVGGRGQRGWRLGTRITLAFACLVVLPASSAWGNCVGQRACPYRLVRQIGGPDPRHFGAISGLAFDRRGFLYVADAGSAQLAVFDPSGRYRGRLLRFGTGAGELADAAGVAATPRGTLVVGAGNTVKEITTTGRVVRTFGGSHIHGVSVGPTGVTWTVDGHSLDAYGPTGRPAASWLVGDPGSPVVPETVAAGPTRVFVGALNMREDGDAIVVSSSQQGVYGFGLDGRPAFSPDCRVTLGVQTDNPPTCLASPLAAGADGTFWTTARDDVLEHLSADGADLGRRILPVAQPAGAPTALAISGAGKIAVAGSDHVIRVLAPASDTPQLVLGHAESRRSTLGAPVAVAAAPDHTIYIADAVGGHIDHFTAGGRYLGNITPAIPQRPPSLGPSLRPSISFTGLAIAATGQIVTAIDDTVYRYSPTKRPLGSFAVPGGIAHLALSPRGQINVLLPGPSSTPRPCPMSEEIAVYSQTGQLVRCLNAQLPPRPGGEITGMSIDVRGHIYLTSQYRLVGPPLPGAHDGIDVLNADGALLHSINVGQPQSAAADTDGQIFVTTDQNRLSYPPATTLPTNVTVLSPNGRRTRIIATTGSKPAQLRSPGEVAIDHGPNETAVLVVDAGNHRIQRFTLAETTRARAPRR